MFVIKRPPAADDTIPCGIFPGTIANDTQTVMLTLWFSATLYSHECLFG